MEKKLLSLAETQQQLGIGKSTLFRAVARGDLKTIKYGARTFVEPAEVERFIASLREQGGQAA